MCSGVACRVCSELDATDEVTGDEGDSVGVAGNKVKPWRGTGHSFFSTACTMYSNRI